MNPNLTQSATREPHIYHLHEKVPYCSGYYSLFLMLAGSVRMQVKENSFSLSTGELFAVPPDSLTALIPDSFTDILLVEIRPSFLAGTNISPDLLLTPVCSTQEPALRRLAEPLRKLTLLSLQDSLENQYQILSQLYLIVDVLQTASKTYIPASMTADIQDDETSAGNVFRKDQTEKADAAGISADKKYRNMIHRYLSENISEPVSLQDAAAFCGLTPQYLSSWFQKSFHCTFMDYANQKKAEYAVNWLSMESISDEQLAELSGFRTLAAFQKTILALYHIPLHELRVQRLEHVHPLPQKLITDQPAFLADPAGETQKEQEHAPSRFIALPVQDIDFSQEYTVTVPDSWRCFLNIGSAFRLSTRELRTQAAEIQDRVGFSYGRVERILDLTTLHTIGNREFFSFENVYLSLDFLTNIHLIPCLELGFVDTRQDYPLGENYVIPQGAQMEAYFEKILEILPSFISGCSNRFGREEVSRWIIEFHYKPEDAGGGTFWNYLQWYKKAERIIHALIPEMTVGGCGFSGSLSETSIRNMTAEIQKTSIRMDFYSIHLDGCVREEDYHPDMPAAPAFLKDLADQRISRLIRVLRQTSPGKPVYLTAFSPCGMQLSYLNDSIYQCAYLIHFYLQHMTELDGIGYHQLSDINYEEASSNSLLFGGSGIYSQHSLRKPVYNCFTFLKQMYPILLFRQEDCLITASSRYNYQFLLTDTATLPDALSLKNNGGTAIGLEDRSLPGTLHAFRIRGAIPGLYLARFVRINATEGNLLAIWKKLPGLQYVSNNSAHYRYISNPRVTLETMLVGRDGVLKLQIPVSTGESLLILIDYQFQ